MAYRANTLLDEDGVGTSTPDADDSYPRDLGSHSRTDPREGHHKRMRGREF